MLTTDTLSFAGYLLMVRSLAGSPPKSVAFTNTQLALLGSSKLSNCEPLVDSVFIGLPHPDHSRIVGGCPLQYLCHPIDVALFHRKLRQPFDHAKRNLVSLPPGSMFAGDTLCSAWL